MPGIRRAVYTFASNNEALSSPRICKPVVVLCAILNTYNMKLGFPLHVSVIGDITLIKVYRILYYNR